jgi:hypothetical protein
MRATRSSNRESPASVGSQTVAVNITGDTTPETNETFVLNLSNAANAVPEASPITATIVNDDTAPQPTLTIADITFSEGNVSSKTGTFTVSLSAPRK